jgi:uncharacterized protein YqfA (UPF0365 family)
MDQNDVQDALRAGFSAGLCCGLSFVVMPILFFLVTTPWLKGYLSSANVPMLSIVGMRLRGSPVGMLVDTQIALVQSGIQANIRQVEAAYLANRHRIVQPGDLYEILKVGLAQTEQRPAWADAVMPGSVSGQAYKQ